MRLTSNSLLEAESTINTNGDRTLTLRSLQLSLLEHLDSVGDIHEVLDITDNDIRILGNFPVLIKLRTLLTAQNRISSIQHDLAQYLPQLECLSLVANSINSLSDLLPLRSFKQLHSLYLNDNNITKQENYRLLVVWLLPELRVLDFAKIKSAERAQSEELFGSFEKPSELAQSLLQDSKVVLQDVNKETEQIKRVLRKLTDEEREVLKTELRNATSLDEIDRIENTLRNGYI